MAYVKVGLDGLAVPAKIQYLRRLAAGITGNPNFLNPSPGPAELEAKAHSLESTYNAARAARLESKTKTGLQDDADAAADDIVVQLANYVNDASKGDPAKIESAGFAVRSTPAPIGPLPAPNDVQVEPSEHSGSADLRWGSVYGAKSYVIERAADAPTPVWTLIGASTKARTSLNSMISGTKYWFRVAAIGSAGQSAWSDPVPLFAP